MVSPGSCATCGRSGRDYTLIKGECPRCYVYRRTHGGQTRPPDLPPGGPPKGERHFAWKGEHASIGRGHARAQQLFPLGPCQRCGRPGRERHHHDGNPHNNDPANVIVVCRRCHLALDGRLAAFVAAGDPYRNTPQDPKPCANCSQLWKPLRQGECRACDQYRRRHGEPRPKRLWRMPW